MPSIFLTWKNNSNALTGQRLYRATVPIDPANPPSARASLAREARQFEDTTVVEATTYYYRVSTVLANGTELFSGQLVVSAQPQGDPYWANVIFMAPFTSDFNDRSASAVAVQAVGACRIEPADGAVSGGCLVAPNAAYLLANVNAAFGAGDFTIEHFLKTSANSPAFGGFFSCEGLVGQDWSLVSLTVTQSAANSGSVWISATGNSWTPVSGATANFSPLNNGQWHHVAIVRQGNRIKAFLDGALRIDVAVSGSLPQRGVVTSIGKKLDGLTHALEARIQYLRITKGVARYTSAFSPPTQPFPDHGV